MLRFSAHLGYQFNEVPFAERFAAAAAAGYRAVEFPNPYVFDKNLLADKLAEHQLTLVQFGSPAGRPGEKGIAGYAGREREFRAGLADAVRYARAANCRMIHPMAGVNRIDNKSDWRVYCNNIGYAARYFSDQNITLLLEVMSLPTVKGYFLNSVDMFTALIAQTGDDNIKLLFDTRHKQVISQDDIGDLAKYYEHIAHIQISDFPGRHEPGTGNIDFNEFYRILTERNYQGWLGCEYHPLKDTVSGLSFMKHNN